MSTEAAEKLDMSLFAQLEERFKHRQGEKPVDVTDLVKSIVDAPEFGLDWLNRQLNQITHSFHVSNVGGQLVLMTR
jgi:hypothetical protein